MKSGSATYDALGNILTRSDVVGTYLYGTSRPHAITTAGDCTYLYDANGSIIRRDRSGVYEFSANWNSFNKPVSLFAMLEGSEFEYDVNGKRTKQLIFEDGGQVVRKKIYIAETYEIEEVLANPTESDRSLWQWTPVHSRIYVDTPVGRVGIRQQAASTDGTGAVNRSYLHKDHLGSVVAVSDDAANIAYYSFDAWGNRRDASDWSSILPSEIESHTSALTDRGYTGHEQLDHLQLVHMNGRIYDPVIGRMITPDPLIQAPQNLQSFNRYSYVWNNPLTNTDPSGFMASGSNLKKAADGTGTPPTTITPIKISEQDALNSLTFAKNSSEEAIKDTKIFSDTGGLSVEEFSSTVSSTKTTIDSTGGNDDELGEGANIKDSSGGTVAAKTYMDPLKGDEAASAKKEGLSLVGGFTDKTKSTLSGDLNATLNDKHDRERGRAIWTNPDYKEKVSDVTIEDKYKIGYGVSIRESKQTQMGATLTSKFPFTKPVMSTARIDVHTHPNIGRQQLPTSGDGGSNANLILTKNSVYYVPANAQGYVNLGSPQELLK